MLLQNLIAGHHRPRRRSRTECAPARPADVRVECLEARFLLTTVPETTASPPPTALVDSSGSTVAVLNSIHVSYDEKIDAAGTMLLAASTAAHSTPATALFGPSSQVAWVASGALGATGQAVVFGEALRPQQSTITVQLFVPDQDPSSAATLSLVDGAGTTLIGVPVSGRTVSITVQLQPGSVMPGAALYDVIAPPAGRATTFVLGVSGTQAGTAWVGSTATIGLASGASLTGAVVDGASSIATVPGPVAPVPADGPPIAQGETSVARYVASIPRPPTLPAGGIFGATNPKSPPAAVAVQVTAAQAFPGRAATLPALIVAAEPGAVDLPPPPPPAGVVVAQAVNPAPVALPGVVRVGWIAIGPAPARSATAWSALAAGVRPRARAELPEVAPPGSPAPALVAGAVLAADEPPSGGPPRAGARVRGRTGDLACDGYGAALLILGATMPTLVTAWRPPRGTPARRRG